MVRSQMPAQERHLRSRLVQLLSGCGMVRGSLSVRERTCGKPNCRCARGEKHRGVYLVFSHQGRFRQVFVSRRHEAAVRQWVEQYHEVRRLLEELSELYLAKVSRRDDVDDA